MDIFALLITLVIIIKIKIRLFEEIVGIIIILIILIRVIKN
jgi:hypothetical protein